MTVDADELEAGEGSHLDLLTVQGVGGQLAGGVVVAPDLGGVIGAPGAVHAGHQVAGLQLAGEGLVLQADEAGVLGDVDDGLGDVGTGGLIPVAEVGDAVLIQAQLQTGTGVEAVEVPAVGQVHGNLLAGGSSLLQHGVEALDILFGVEGAVVEHEVAIVSGQGVGIQLAVNGGGVHRRGRVAGLDVLQIHLGRNLLQSAGGHQLVQLVIRESVHIGSSLRVVQNGVLALGLGLNTNVDGQVDLILVLLDELVRDLAQQILIFLGAPHGQGDVLNGAGGSAFRGTRLSSGLGSRHAGTSAAGGQAQRHSAGEGQSNRFFHKLHLLL